MKLCQNDLTTAESIILKLFNALQFVLFNTYVRFGNIFPPTNTGYPNSSPSIADLYLAWGEYCLVAYNSNHDINVISKLLNKCILLTSLL